METSCSHRRPFLWLSSCVPALSFNHIVNIDSTLVSRLLLRGRCACRWLHLRPLLPPIFQVRGENLNETFCEHALEAAPLADLPGRVVADVGLSVPSTRKRGTQDRIHVSGSSPLQTQVQPEDRSMVFLGSHVHMTC